MEHLASAGIGSSTIAVIYLVIRVFKYANGHRLVSDCCGKKGEIGFVVRDMPPSPQEETKNHPTAASGVGESKGIPSVRIPALPESPKEQGT